MTAALDLCAPATHPRFCLDCGHIHGVLAYGLCMERVEGGVCPCVELRAAHQRPRRLKDESEVTARTLSRWSARMFAEMSPAERAKYERWVRRWLEQDELTLWEFADVVGLQRDLLKRTALSLGLPITFGLRSEARR